MDDVKNNSKLIIICSLFIVIFLIIALVFKDDSSKSINNSNDTIIKEHYNANDIVKVKFSESDIVKKYLSDYRNLMMYDVEEAYNLLNGDYRSAKFSNLDNFINYINEYKSSSTYSLEVEKYSKVISNGKRIYDVVDKSGYHYIFKENSIMDYEVFLDDSTVEIK